MKLSLGIDIGSSSTKAAALDEHGALLGTLQVHADDPRTSAYGVLGRFLDQQGASFDDVEKIVLTGLGSTYFHENIFGIPTIHALELDAIGRGGLYLSGLDEALVVSLMGGLLGLALSVGLVKILGPILDMTLTVPINVAWMAIGFSVLIGVVFGLYPANKASKLKPIEALHYEG